jgi:hypothetical protein
LGSRQAYVCIPTFQQKLHYARVRERIDRKIIASVVEFGVLNESDGINKAALLPMSLGDDKAGGVIDCVPLGGDITGIEVRH